MDGDDDGDSYSYKLLSTIGIVEKDLCKTCFSSIVIEGNIIEMEEKGTKSEQ